MYYLGLPLHTGWERGVESTEEIRQVGNLNFGDSVWSMEIIILV